MKLHNKIALAIVSLLSIILAIGVSTLIAFSFRNTLKQEQEAIKETSTMLVETQQVVGNIEKWQDSDDFVEALGRISKQVATYGIGVVEDGNVIYANRFYSSKELELDEAQENGETVISFVEMEKGEMNLYAVTALDLNEERMYLIVERSLTEIYCVQKQFLLYYRWTFVAMIIVAILSGYWIARTITRPLSKLTKVTQEMSLGNYKYRTKIESNDEIGELSAGFDEMSRHVEQSVNELKEAAVRQELFMGAFAHELKTPMTSIIGYADMIRGQNLTYEEQIEAAEYIFSEGKRLERLSFSLLDIFVLNKSELKISSVNPKHLAEEISAHFFRKSDVKWTCECEEAICNWEVDLIKTLLLNIVDNAQKAIDINGRIRITGNKTKMGYRYVIQDNGKGMKAEELPHINEAFYRVDKSRARAKGSVGLGLTLCQKIVELHNGRIRFESKYQVGTRVTIELGGAKNEDAEE